MKTVDHLDRIRKKIQARDEALKEARARRDDVLMVAATFTGNLRVFRSGSLATGFVNHPVDDADGGMVLDRRVYPELGPDGNNELPYEIVDDVHDHLRVPLRKRYPRLRIEKVLELLQVSGGAGHDHHLAGTDLEIRSGIRGERAVLVAQREHERLDVSELRDL